MSTLTIKLKVEFECFPPSDMDTTITFLQWLPTQDDHSITIQESNITITLWFDKMSVWGGSQLSDEELKKYVNVKARYVNVCIQMTGISEELAEYIQSRDFTRFPDDSEKELQIAYDKIGETIFTTVLRRINRLIAYSRSKKGQYWVTEFSLDHSLIENFFSSGKAEGQINDGPWFRFKPNGGPFTIRIGNHDRYIQESEWQELESFILGNQKPKLVGELLSRADLLLTTGQRRSAITEAVTALEFCLYQFGRSPDADKAFATCIKDRIGSMSLKSQIEHFGLTGSIRYLLPLILSEEIMPISILKECEEAILHRQNIAHNGQRDIQESIARKAISNIRKCCDILEKLTIQEPD